MANEPITDFRAVIDLWPTRADLARDLGITETLAGQMYYSNSIHSRWYQMLIRAAHKRDIEGLTLDLLVTLSKERAERRSSPETTKKKTEDVVAVET